MAVKTLHLTNAFHSHSGGISTFYAAMLNVANQQEREMRLVVPGEEDGVEQVGRWGKIYFVRAPKAPLNSSYRCIYLGHYLHPQAALRGILRQERPQLIEICDKYNLHYLGGMFREGLLRDLDFRPVMLGLSCERMDENVAAYLGDSIFHRWFCRWYMHWMYFPFFDHHTAVSEHAAAELVTASKKHAVRRGIWIRPMGVDAARFSPSRRSEAMRRRLMRACGGCADTFLLLYAGRLAPEKNLPLLIEMMRVLGPDYRLLVVGDGIERSNLQRLAAEQAPGLVCFLEHVTDREQLAELYASCDAFVHPNPREPFGIAPLEAMASGLPLVAANSGGITSFANQHNAWLAAPTPWEFAAAVRQALHDPAARQARVQAALGTAAAHTWDRAAREYFALYDAIYASFQGRHSLASCPPYAWSTSGAAWSKAVIVASNHLAQTVFRSAVRLSSQTASAPTEVTPSRYVELAPSVTGKEEKPRTFCIPEGQT